jgi:two-component system LytT family response regulator
MPAVIFVTAYDEYATQAFEVNAVDYLLKPFTETRLADALRRWLIGNAAGSASLRALLETITRENATYLERISVRVRHGYTVVNVADIDYLESENNYIRLFTGEQSYLVRGTLSAIEQQLDPSKFARIHRSVIVNLTQVTMLKPWFSGDYVVVLKGGRELRLTRTFTAVLQRGFGLSTKHQLRA